MKKFLTILCVVVLFGFGMVSQANATLLTYGDNYYVGLIWDNTPSSPADEVGYINDLITLDDGAGKTDVYGSYYDRLYSNLVPIDGFPLAVVAGGEKDETGGTTFDATGFSYILGKYAGPQAGSWVWYLGDNFIGEVELPSYFADNQYGLSHISAYNPGTPVPEPATMLLFGTGLLGLAAFGKRKFKK